MTTHFLEMEISSLKMIEHLMERVVLGDAYMSIATSYLCFPVLYVSHNVFICKVEANHGSTLIGVSLCDTFFYYLFAYDNAQAFEWSMLLEDGSINRENRGILDPCSWISFPFDPINEFNGGTCEVMLGQDDKQNLGEFIGTFSMMEVFLEGLQST